jgi:hypothetical protein
MVRLVRQCVSVWRSAQPTALIPHQRAKKTTAAAATALRDRDQRPAEFGERPHDDSQPTGARNDRGDREEIHHRPPPTTTEVFSVIGAMLC